MDRFEKQLSDLDAKLSVLAQMDDDEWGDKSILRCETMCQIWTVKFQQLTAQLGTCKRPALLEKRITEASKQIREFEKAKATAIEKRKMQMIVQARQIIAEVRDTRQAFDSLH